MVAYRLIRKNLTATDAGQKDASATGESQAVARVVSMRTKQIHQALR